MGRSSLFFSFACLSLVLNFLPIVWRHLAWVDVTKVVVTIYAAPVGAHVFFYLWYFLFLDVFDCYYADIMLRCRICTLLYARAYSSAVMWARGLRY